MSALLQVIDLKKHFPAKGERAVVRAVDGVSFDLAAGQTLGIVGESGCGKSTLGRAILRLIEPSAGKVIFDGIDLSTLNGRSLRSKRREMQMIFQDPFASLDPRQTVGAILTEPLTIHDIGDRNSRQGAVEELLELVGLEADAAKRYPHEFSGGQRQRIGIARAVALRPKLIIADEPVSALDVSIRSQILNLLSELKARLNLSLILISHDLAVVEHLSDRVAVMYLGRIVESSSAVSLFANPKHPYTEALVSAVPIPDPERRGNRIVLSGEMPNPERPPPGCRFHPRCPKAMDVCLSDEPIEREIGLEPLPCIVCCHLY